jgi:hypothetical protein
VNVLPLDSMRRFHWWFIFIFSPIGALLIDLSTNYSEGHTRYQHVSEYIGEYNTLANWHSLSMALGY